MSPEHTFTILCLTDKSLLPDTAWAWELCQDKNQPIQSFLKNPEISFATQKCALICRLFVHINTCKQGLLETSSAEPSPLCPTVQETPRSNQCSYPWEAKRREEKGWINVKRGKGEGKGEVGKERREWKAREKRKAAATKWKTFQQEKTGYDRHKSKSPYFSFWKLKCNVPTFQFCFL